MSKVVCEISMSLDGFITGPNVRAGNGRGTMGIGFTAGCSTVTHKGRARIEMIEITLVDRGRGCKKANT